MIILLKPNKALVVTKNSKIYQKESLVDNMIFYLPDAYNDYDLTKFTPTLYYKNSGNEAYAEILTPIEGVDKEGYTRYQLPVDTKLTKSAGEISMYLSLVWYDEETEKTYVLKSGVLTITVSTWDDYFRYLSDESISTMDNKIAEMQVMVDELKAVADTYAGSVPNDLALDNEGLLQLSIDGEPTGEGVTIVTSGEDVGDSNPSDAVVDLSTIQI